LADITGFLCSVLIRLYANHLVLVAGVEVCSGPMCTVLVPEIFGLTTLAAPAANRTFSTAHTEAGTFTSADTEKTCQYRAFQIRMQVIVFRVKIAINNTVVRSEVVVIRCP